MTPRYDIEPDGTVFEFPASLEIIYGQSLDRGAPRSGIRLARSDGDVWTAVVPSVNDLETGRVVGRLHHLSTYAAVGQLAVSEVCDESGVHRECNTSACLSAGGQVALDGLGCALPPCGLPGATNDCWHVNACGVYNEAWWIWDEGYATCVLEPSEIGYEGTPGWGGCSTCVRNACKAGGGSMSPSPGCICDLCSGAGLVDVLDAYDACAEAGAGMDVFEACTPPGDPEPDGGTTSDSGGTGPNSEETGSSLEGTGSSDTGSNPMACGEVVVNDGVAQVTLADGTMLTQPLGNGGHAVSGNGEFYLSGSSRLGGYVMRFDTCPRRCVDSNANGEIENDVPILGERGAPGNNECMAWYTPFHAPVVIVGVGEGYLEVGGDGYDGCTLDAETGVIVACEGECDLVLQDCPEGQCCRAVLGAGATCEDLGVRETCP